LPFKCNLQRYSAGMSAESGMPTFRETVAGSVVRLAALFTTLLLCVKTHSIDDSR
jgi:hypothetical protein